MAYRLDPKEMLIRQMESQTKRKPERSMQTNLPDISGPHGYADTYLVLDTYIKSQESEPQFGSFVWQLNIQGSTTRYAIGVRHTLKNIVEIELGNFSMPLLDISPHAITLTGLPTTTDADVTNAFLVGPDGYANINPAQTPLYGYPNNEVGNQTNYAFVFNQMLYDQMFTIYFKNAGRQSIQDLAGKGHHFEYRLLDLQYYGQTDTYFRRAINNYSVYT